MHRRLLHVLAPVLLAACGGGEDAPDTPAPTRATAPEGADPAWAGPDLSTPGDGSALVLDQLPIQLDLPEADTTTDRERATFVLEISGHGNQGRQWFSAPLPFRVPKATTRFAPEGMRVLVDGREAEFVLGRVPNMAGRKDAWRLQGTTIQIASSTGTADEVKVIYPPALDELRRVTWADAKADLSDQEFVRYGVTWEQVSMEGLLLPAPTTAAWDDVTLPEGARFLAHATIAPSPLERRSDGARVELTWTSGDTAEEHALDLPGDLTAFQAWEIDLSAHAGQTGTLTLRTLPGEDATDDLVFLGAPQVLPGTVDDVRRIVVIGIDTLRPDHLGLYGYHRDTSPELDAWAQDAVVFDKAWTPAPRTRPSFRTATTGRMPLEAVCAEPLGSVFDRHGFATAGIVSNVHLNPRFGFQKGFDYWRLDGAAKVDEQVDRAIAWLDQEQTRDSYLFLHIMDPHIFYVAPEPYASRFMDGLPPLPEGAPLPKGEALPNRFNRSDVYAWLKRGKLTEAHKQHIVARYDAEIAYTSAELKRFFDHLDTLPGRTTVVLHSDHGEEFFEHGGFEHNHTLYDDTTRAVMIVKPPGGTGVVGARSDAPASLQDIAATLYELAGIEDPAPTDGQSLVPVLKGEGFDPERPIPIGYLQYGHERWGVSWRGHKYVLHTGSGEEELYDLEADPDEEVNLADTMDTEPWWRKTAEVHSTPIGHGWRVHVSLKEGDTLSLALPAAAVGADVLDPESVTDHPKNQEWGEVPDVLPSDVGEVSLSDDGRTVTITGGPKGRGIVYVLFPEQTAVGGEATLGDQTVALTASTSLGANTLRPEAGIVVVPRPSEASIMATCGTGEGGDDADTMSMLQAMGYVDKEGPGVAEQAAEGDDEED